MDVLDARAARRRARGGARPANALARQFGEVLSKRFERRKISGTDVLGAILSVPCSIRSS